MRNGPTTNWQASPTVPPRGSAARPVHVGDLHVGDRSEMIERIRQLVPLTREAWVGAPPWLNEAGQRWWRQVGRGSATWGRARHAPPGKCASQLRLVVRAVTFDFLAIVIVSVLSIGSYAGGAQDPSGHVSVALWAVLGVVVAYIFCVPFALAYDKRHVRESARPLTTLAWTQLGDLLRDLGLANRGSSFLASDGDRLWTLERLEVAEARGMLSQFALTSLGARALASQRVGQLYGVLTDTLRYPDAAQVDLAVAKAVAAVVDGRIAEDDLAPLFERLADEPSPDSLISLTAAYAGRPSRTDRESAQRLLDDAAVIGQLSSAGYGDRSTRLRTATTASAVDEALEGLRWPLEDR